MRSPVILVLFAAFLSGCSTHFSTLRPEGSSSQLIHLMPEEEAFRLAYSSMTTTIPDRKITVLNGPARGYSTYTRFILDTYTQQVLVFRAQGLDSKGQGVQGYYFEVSGSGSSGSGRATNVRLFEALSANAQAKWPGVVVTNVATVPYVGAATMDPAAAPGVGALRQNRIDVMETFEKLRDLRDSGTITDQEYQSKKAELLNRL